MGLISHGAAHVTKLGLVYATLLLHWPPAERAIQGGCQRLDDQQLIDNR